MPDPDPILDRRDGQLARRLIEALGRDGWSVGCGRAPCGRWRARVVGPSPEIACDASGTSRVSAISGAHVGAVRRLDDVPPTSLTP